MKNDLIALAKYVNAVNELAEGVERDIKNGKSISNDTVLRLSKFISAQNTVAFMLETLEKQNEKLN